MMDSARIEEAIRRVDLVIAGTNTGRDQHMILHSDVQTLQQLYQNFLRLVKENNELREKLQLEQNNQL